MPDTPFRKTSAMRLLERLHPGRSIEEIVANACETRPTPEAAAAELGISRETLRVWQALFAEVERRQPAGVR